MKFSMRYPGENLLLKTQMMLSMNNSIAASFFLNDKEKILGNTLYTHFIIISL